MLIFDKAIELFNREITINPSCSVVKKSKELLEIEKLLLASRNKNDPLKEKFLKTELEIQIFENENKAKTESVPLTF